jgi:hypothetical protein
MYVRKSIFVALSWLLLSSLAAQQKVTAIVTTNKAAAPVSYTGVKGAGLVGANGNLASNWDSTGTNFTVNFSQTTANITSITQFNVYNHPRAFITWPLNATVKLRRLANAYVNNTGNYYNFWSVSASGPSNNATTGTFNLLAPEVTAPESAFLSNNINSGYDNIFQNTIASLHANNIERVDYILPNGLVPRVQLDLDGAGAVIFDRGGGDPFNIALILSIDANGDPFTYGPMVQVQANQFGGNLKAGNSPYVILTHDPKFGVRSRPSTQQNQNMAGVFISLTDMGLSLNTRFYGYSIFPPDVTIPTANWNTYPTNSNNNSQLDPVNVISLFKDVNSLLPVPINFQLREVDHKAELKFTLYNEAANEKVAVERSGNGYDFEIIGEIKVSRAGNYSFTDQRSLSGITYYRIRLVEKSGNQGYSDIKLLRVSGAENFMVGPNPASDQLHLSLPPSWNGKEVQAELTTSNGTRCYQRRWTSGASDEALPVQSLSAGIYYLRLTNLASGESVVKPIAVKH